MSNKYSQDRDIQDYLELGDQITYGSEEAGLPNSIYFASANFVLTTILTQKFIPTALRLSTVQSYAAYYAIAFVSEFISEIFERYDSGSNIASYLGNDYDDIEMDWGDEIYDNIGESFIQASYDMLMGLNSMVDFVIDGTLDLAGLTESASGDLPTLVHDKREFVETKWTWGGRKDVYEYTFQEGNGNDYLDMDEREHTGGNNTITVKGGDGQDYIANADNAYGQDGNDQIKHVNNAWGGKHNDYLFDISGEARGEDGEDYIEDAYKAFGGDNDDLIINSNTAYGDSGADVLLDNKRSFGGAQNDYIVGRTSNEDNQAGAIVDWAITTVNSVIGNSNDIYLLDGGSGNDYLEGRFRDEVLKGGTGSDVLIGGDGNDAIDGGEEAIDPDNEAEVLAGRAFDNERASDVAIFRKNANFTFTKESGNWDYKVTGHGTDYFKNIEAVVVEAGASDNIIDASALEISSSLDGRAGNDLIKGGENNDILVGGYGRDYLIGGLGYDYLDGGDGNDVLIASGTSYMGRFNETELAVIEGELPFSVLKTPLVTIYEHGSYGGKSKNFYNFGNFTDSQFGIGNDALSSLKVADGYQVTLYQHNNYTGNSVTYKAGTTYVGDWFNDETSSLIIEEAPPVTIYRHSDHNGTRQELTLGNYNVSDLNMGDNQLSSLKIADGYQVTLYERSNYQGDSITFTSDTTYVGNSFNDKTSSLKVERLPNMDDSLVGGAGNDILDGGSGLDYLAGGTGADKFVIRNPSRYNDVITDFNASEGDQLWINRDAFSGNASYNSSTNVLSVGGTVAAVLENAVGFNVSKHVKFVTSEQLDARMASTKTEEAIGEYGTVNNLTHAWKTIELDGAYINPVVIASDPTFNGRDVSGIRLRNVDSDSFEIRIQEANYHNDSHSNGEIVSYVVVEAGEWELTDGTRIAAGLHDTNNLVTHHNDFDTVDFTNNGLTDFVSTPTVLSQIQTYETGSEWVTTRLKGQSTTGFSLGMQEEAAYNTGAHVEETIGWLAIEQGVSRDANGDLLLQGGTTGAYVDENFDTITFGEGFDGTPTVIAKLGSAVGLDPSVLRLDGDSISTTGFDAFVQEDQSLTPDIGHADESVSYLAFNGGSGTLMGLEF